MDNNNKLNSFQIMLLVLLFGVIMTNFVGMGSIYVDDGIIRDADGNPLSSHYDVLEDEYVLNIHDSHLHTEIVNSELHRHTGVATTLTVATSGNGSEYIITVADTTGFSVGDYLHIQNGAAEISHPQVLALTATTFTLDRRIDKAHPIGTEVEQSILDMASLAGNISHPVEYWIEPPANETWHVQRILFSMVHSSAGDLGLFGNLPALTNGVLVRARISGQYGTLTNWKTNGDIKTDMFDVEFDTRSGGGGSYGTSGRGSFIKTGAVLRLDGSNNDRLEIYIQDDITGLDTFLMKAQGHIEDR